MKSLFFKAYILFFVVLFSTNGCFSDLNTKPLDKDITTSADVFNDPTAYKRVLAKLYAGLAVTGQEGPAGKGDIGGIDEGFGQYLRMLWYHQELPTETALVGWADQTIADFHDQDWTSGDGFIFAFYSRIYYQISVCNEFLRQTSVEKLEERAIDATLKSEIETYRAEARFLRALSYYHALDHFRNVPFVTELDKIGAFSPKQASAIELFDFIEKELKDIESKLKPATTNEYGRVDAAGAQLLLSRLYINAETYIGTNKYLDALTYSEKVIQSGYKLDAAYPNLFLADNHNSKEIIFPIAYNSVETKSYGGTTFLIKAAIGGSMDPKTYGVDGGWGGIRVTKEMVQKFPVDLTGVLVSFNQGKTSSHQRVLIPGSFQDVPFDGTDVTNSLTSPEKNKIFEGYRYFKAGDEFVVLKNPSSTLNGKLGDNGQDGTLDIGGENIKVASEGFYKITINTNDNTYTLSKESWSIKGTATNGESLPMTWDKKRKYLRVLAQLQEGEYVFVNNKNEIFGDISGDAILENNGIGIKVNGGGYDIYLDLDRKDYTYEINSTDYDRRAIFYTKGQTLEINDRSLFTNGYACPKFKNIKADGSPGGRVDFPDTDFPMLRLAEAYLNASEAILRSNGDKNKAVAYFNIIRQRAYGGSLIGNKNTNNFTLQDILDERAREFYWEAHRRTDLVRFGQFTNGSYVWAWKGGIKEGKAVEAFRNVYPIPASDLNANPNLQQNEGY